MVDINQVMLKMQKKLQNNQKNNYKIYKIDFILLKFNKNLLIK